MGDEERHCPPDSQSHRFAAQTTAHGFVQQAPWNMDKEPSYGLWRVFKYDGNNSAKFSSLLQVWGLGLHDPE